MSDETGKDRDGQFQTELFERYQRSEKALVLALLQMYVEGVSTRKVPAHGGGIRGRNRVPGPRRLRSQLAPCSALRNLAPQATRTRTNYPEE